MKLTKKELRKIKDTLKKISNSAEILLFFYANSGRDLTDEQAKMLKKEYNRITRLVKKINQN